MTAGVAPPSTLRPTGAAARRRRRSPYPQWFFLPAAVIYGTLFLLPTAASFWFALTLILWLGVNWRLLPITGSASWQNFVMPAIALGYYVTPAVMRLTRAGVLEVLSADYIRTARAKGLRPMTVLFKHALRNAIIPVVSLAAVQFGFMNSLDIVPVLVLAAKQDLRFELMETTFFLSRQKNVPVEGGEGMAFWRDKLFAVLARNAADMTDFLSIPTNRVI